MNKIILLGRITKDPELRTTQSGKSVAKFTVAVNRKGVSAENGNRIVDFIDCVAWNGQADTISKYFKKGNQICVNGSLQTRNYETQEGVKKYVSEVIVSDFDFVDKKNTVEANVIINEDDKNEYEDISEEITNEELPF